MQGILFPRVFRLRSMHHRARCACRKSNPDNARDLQGDEPLELAQSQARMLSRIILPQLARIALGRSRQEMDRAHLGSDQSLDMSAEMGRAWRTPNDVDSFVSTQATPVVKKKREN